MQILSGLILLAVLIVFHELGHFLFAKMLGVRVLVFSLGFGPKLLGFKIGDTEYRISAIPLGGYVRMFGESLEEELTDEEKKCSFIHQAIWRKSLIAFAGPLFNFILPVILFFALLVGNEQVFIPTVGTILQDSVAEKAGILPDDRIVMINDLPVETFSDLAREIASNPDNKIKLTIDRPGTDKKQIITLTPEAKSAQSPFDKSKKVGRIGIMPAIEKPIVMVEENSAYYKAGLRDLDTVIAINDNAISSMYALEKSLTKLPEQSIFKVIRKNGESEKEIIFSVLTNKEEHIAPKSIMVINSLAQNDDAQVSPQVIEESKEILASLSLNDQKQGLSSAKGTITKVEALSTAAFLGLKPYDRIMVIDGEKVTSDHFLEQSLMQDPKAPHIMGVKTKEGEEKLFIFRLQESLDENIKLDTDLAHIFGITTAQVFKPGEIVERKVGIIEAFGRACTQTLAIAAMTGQSLWMLVSGGASVSQVGGPIMIFDVAHQAADKGLSYYIFIMCLLSVNLGLLNLLPIPALDGGHLLLFGIEAVQRKPLTPRTRAIATQIGIVFLLALMGLAIFNDLYRLFK